MEECGVAPDTVVFSSAIDACSKAGDHERGLRLFRKMSAAGVQANIVTYSTLARPFARNGDWGTVERLQAQMEAEGLRMNEYFFYVLLDAYSNAKPKEAARAEQAFRQAMWAGLEPNNRGLSISVTGGQGRLRVANIPALIHASKHLR